MKEMHRYFFLITPFSTTEKPIPFLFVFETENNDTVGTYTVYHHHPDAQAYWSDWLSRRYFIPQKFVNRFGYSGVQAGPLRDDDHFRELLELAQVSPDGIIA